MPCLEASLRTGCFNAMVQHKEADVPEMLIRSRVEGRQAEYGPDWTPSAIIARRVAAEGAKGASIVVPAWQPIYTRQHIPAPGVARTACPVAEHKRRQPSAGASDQGCVPKDSFMSDSMSMSGSEAFAESCRARGEQLNQLEKMQTLRSQDALPMVSTYRAISMKPPKPAWASMMPVKEKGLRQASAPDLRPASRNSTTVSVRPELQDGATGGASKTSNVWKVSEISIGRDSFNAIVDSRKFDVPSAIMRQLSMGRQAEFGPKWTPPGIHARQLSELLTKCPHS